MERSQAHIEKVVALKPIPNADRIEVAQILGWECVVVKGDLQVGDYCVYIEIDSLVPPTPEFEFLQKYKYRVRTIKLRGQLSQGLALPITDSMRKKIGSLEEGKDVAKALGITKHDPQAAAELKALARKKRGRFMRFLMSFAIFRKIWFWLHPYANSAFPSWIPKSDETRVQACPERFLNPSGEDRYYISEKLDGQSVTIYYKYSEKKKKRFGVCSRNISLDPEASGNWQNVARKYDLKNKLQDDYIKSIYKDGIAIQGEILAPGVQGNPYRVTEPVLYVFNVFDIDGRYYVPLGELVDVCQHLGLNTVPILDEDFDLSKYTLESILKFAEGFSVLEGREDVNREGIVIRAHKQKPSFKAISNLYLLKFAKDDEPEEDSTEPPKAE